MFSALAPRYRQFNAWASLGQDHRWRRAVIEEIEGARSVLDVGTGTGDLARLAQKHGMEGTGADISSAMLDQARRSFPGITWVQCGADELPFPDQKFDAVVSAYVLRNLYRGGVLERSLREASRVLKPQGKLVFLDLTQPTGGFLRWGHRCYNRTVLPFFGRLIFGNNWPGSYLAASIEALPPVDDLRALFVKSGFRGLNVRPLWGGIVSLFIGSRE